ncbi:MAG: hypothetical protein ACFFBD_19190 [Candidatus Hodarchaeota archaeon]
MRRMRLVFLFLMIFALVLPGMLGVQGCACSSNATTNSSRLDLRVDHAYYYDLDEDNYKDDVLTRFIIESTSGYYEAFDNLIYVYLKTPSGLTYYTYFRLYGYIAKVKISVKWFNTVSQAGWYTFTVSFTRVEANYYRYYEASRTFDPPDKGPPGHPYTRVSLSY